MTHDELQDLLEGYVDETLDRATRRTVDSHLAGCAECRQILDDVAPVDLGGVRSGTWTPGDMRRAVRRSLFRVALDAVIIVFSIWLVAWALSLLVVHPLVIDRGGRAGAAVTATADLGIMFNPGASIDEYEFRTDFLGVGVEVGLVTAVGADTVKLGTLESHLGPLAFGSRDTGRLFLQLSGPSEPVAGTNPLAGLPTGTVTTTEIGFEPPIDMARATELAETDLDVRVIWAGFALDGDLQGLGGSVGYTTCDTTRLETEVSSLSSGGGSGTPFSASPSVARAAELARAALADMLSYPGLLDGIGATVSEAEAALVMLEQPIVGSLVVTGPTEVIVDFIADAGPSWVRVMDVDFNNWYQALCGR
jgi:hypothetical protein